MSKPQALHQPPLHCSLASPLRQALKLALAKPRFVLTAKTDEVFCKGKWAFPGGHLEHGESFIGCAERETLEETGLKVKGLKVVNVTNDVFEDARKHYVTLFVLCEMTDSQQEPKVSHTTILTVLRSAH